MTWMLLDQDGNAIATYDDEVEAHVAMRAIVDGEPGAAGSILLIGYDDRGNPVGEAVTYDELPASTVTVTEVPAEGIAVFLTRRTFGLGSSGRHVEADAVPTHVSTSRAVGV
jgi:hypothetical protein